MLLEAVVDAVRPWLPQPTRPFPDSETLVREGMERLQARKSQHGQCPAWDPAYFKNRAIIGELEVT